jgi:hypothetical protein
MKRVVVRVEMHVSDKADINNVWSYVRQTLADGVSRCKDSDPMQRTKHVGIMSVRFTKLVGRPRKIPSFP